MRRFLSFDAHTPDKLKKQLLAYSRNLQHFLFLENRQNNEYRKNPATYSHLDCLAAVEAVEHIEGPAEGAFARLKAFAQQHHEWLVGYLGYDLKNDIEKLKSEHPDGVGLPDFFFFVPRYLVFFLGQNIQVGYLPEHDDKTSTAAFVERVIGQPLYWPHRHRAHLHQRITREAYLQKVKALQQHIARGDVYEANFCLEFFDDKADIDPSQAYVQLRESSPAPFMSFLKYEERYVLSASPERFLKRQENKLIAQPIKGTSKRSSQPEEDQANRLLLENDPKERAENIMIVDLMRNDLTKVALPASVQVEELCKVYSFKQVHQLVSTVSARVQADTHFTDILRAAFPTGSMTGAPKLRAMQLIEQYEESRRGLYAGSIGYVSPTGDFDFSVVIRTLFYHAQRHYLSLQVGSAITSLASPENEYDECLLKADALRRLFDQ